MSECVSKQNHFRMDKYPSEHILPKELEEEDNGIRYFPLTIGRIELQEYIGMPLDIVFGYNLATENDEETTS